MDTTIRSNLQIEQSEYPQLHEDLLSRKPRSRAKRIEQLAHLGLMFEKQLNSGQGELVAVRHAHDELPEQQPKKSRPSRKASAPQQPVEANGNPVLVPPKDFGDDMASLFDDGIKL